jgi:hypothetical protein
MPSRPVSKKTDEERTEKSSKGIGALIGAVGIAIVLIRTFGWAGTTLIIGLLCVNWWATAEQKQRIIEYYVLGTDISGRYPIIISCLVFALVLIAQYKWYGHDKNKLKKEIDRKDGIIKELESQMSRKRVRR